MHKMLPDKKQPLKFVHAYYKVLGSDSRLLFAFT